MAQMNRNLFKLHSAGILLSGILLAQSMGLAAEPYTNACDATAVKTNNVGGCLRTADAGQAACVEKPSDSDGDGVRDEVDRCPNTPPRHAVDASGCSVDTDGDGVGDNKDECPGTKQGVRVDGRGCDLDLDGDGIPYYRDRCQNTPSGVEVDSEGCTVKAVLGDVLFHFGRSGLTEEAKDFLVTFASGLMRRVDVERIRIAGHTDSIGSRAYNKRLSKARASSVMRYLKAKGVTQPMSAVGYGKTKPVANNATSAGRQRNRRVEIELELLVP